MSQSLRFAATPLTSGDDALFDCHKSSITRPSCLKSSYDIDIVRLIGQHLNGLGLKQTVNLLLEESGLHGLDHPIATNFQQHILAGDWDKANSLVVDIANLIFPTQQQQQQQQQQTDPKDKETINQIRLLIAEQKFLEFIEDNHHIRALKCLRLEITPLTNDIKRVQHLATLLMCKSTEEVKQRADWTGKGPQSRYTLVEKIQRFIPPLIMLPPRRLNTLLNQAIQLQRERCTLHLGDKNPTRKGDDDVDSSDVDLKIDHICSSDKFPLNSRQELDNHKTEVWFCQWSNDGTKLATGGLGGKVKIWSLDPEKHELVEMCSFDCTSYSITCLSWSPNDTYLLACGSEDKPDLYIFNVNRKEVHNMINHSDEESTTTCSWHLSGEKFAAASIKGNFNIFDLDGNRRGTREGVRVQCLSFLHKDPNYILAADTLNRIKSYAIKDMSLETDEDDILEERNAIMSFTIDKDDKYIAVNLMEQGVHLWDYRLKTLLRMFPGVCQRNLTIYSSFSSPDSTFLASGSEDGKVYIYHINKDQPVAILHGHSRCVNCVSWNPKHPELLVSVSDDRIIRLWAPVNHRSTNGQHEPQMADNMRPRQKCV